MALHLNLFHEIERQKLAERRDPLKLSMFVLAAIGALCAAYYAWELGRYGSVSRELGRKKAEFEAIDPKAKAAKKQEEELAGVLKVSDALVKRIEGRFYWAPVIQELALLVPREVQITKLSGDLQGDSPKKCQITIDGISAGADPRKVAEELRTAIAEQFGKTYATVVSTFRTLEDGAETVRLDGQQWPTAMFAINIQLTRGEAAASTPPPVRSTTKR
jgi:hypothetical protein